MDLALCIHALPPFGSALVCCSAMLTATSLRRLLAMDLVVSRDCDVYDHLPWLFSARSTSLRAWLCAMLSTRWGDEEGAKGAQGGWRRPPPKPPPRGRGRARRAGGRTAAAESPRGVWTQLCPDTGRPTNGPELEKWNYAQLRTERCPAPFHHRPSPPLVDVSP